MSTSNLDLCDFNWKTYAYLVLIKTINCSRLLTFIWSLKISYDVNLIIFIIFKEALNRIWKHSVLVKKNTYELSNLFDVSLRGFKKNHEL